MAASGRLDQAAVDDVVHAGDVGHSLGGQHRDQRGDLLGVVNRPVAMPATAVSRTVSASTPVASPIVAATPCSPSHRSVLTWPGETQLTRMPCGPNSCASDLLKLTTAALATP